MGILQIKAQLQKNVVIYPNESDKSFLIQLRTYNKG